LPAKAYLQSVNFIGNIYLISSFKLIFLMKQLLIIIFLLVLSNTIFSQEIKYSDGNNSWNADSLGNHRVLIGFSGTGNIAKVVIPWRRRDEHAEQKRIIVEDAKTQQRILNVKAININRESGEIYFEPTSGSGDYYVYYMPYKNEGRSNYPRGVYLKPDTTVSSTWLNAINSNSNIPQATVKEFQSINAFNSFYPMEIIATKAETDALLQKNTNTSYLVFPEDRMHPIKMTSDLPQRWVENGVQQSFSDTALKGENFSFQLGIYALKDLQNMQIKFSDLVASNGNKISSKNISCLNTDGVSYDDKPVHFTVNVPAKKVQAMWCLVDVPQNIAAGLYRGKATVTSDENMATEIELHILISNEVAKNKGVNEPWKMTRLNWLNSDLAQENTGDKAIHTFKSGRENY
jgi:hypothetical protein